MITFVIRLIPFNGNTIHYIGFCLQVVELQISICRQNIVSYAYITVVNTHTFSTVVSIHISLL